MEGDRSRTAAPKADRAAGTAIVAAIAVSVIGFVYLIALGIGFAARTSRNDPISDPWFAAMELLIIALMPAMIALFAAIHSGADRSARTLTRAALACVTVCAALTTTLHAVILAIARHPSVRAARWFDTVLSFRWPSLAYAVDILAWDVFFALAALMAAPAFPSHGEGRAIRRLLCATGLLSLAGLSGIPAGNMALRNLGILGYGVLMPLAAAAMARQWRRYGLPHRG